jgi:Fe-S metabolism associated domain
VQGLAALLVQGLSDCVPADVLGVDPGAIIDALGLKQKLTPSRNNGFLNMFRLMQQKAAQLSGQVPFLSDVLASRQRMFWATDLSHDRLAMMA